MNIGAQKVLDNLRKHDPSLELPANSTAGEIPKRAGLVKKRRKCWSVPANEQAFFHTFYGWCSAKTARYRYYP